MQPMTTLTTAQRQKFRQQAHALKPIILIGAKGLTDAVQKEIGAALETHELLKIKVSEHERDAVYAMEPLICAEHQAEHIQTVGHTITIWRAQTEQKKPAPNRRSISPRTRR
jgi:RNA-binding protein